MKKTIQRRQSEVSISGRRWEIEVMEFLNGWFRTHNKSLEVILGEKGLKKSHPVLWKKLAIPIKEGVFVEGDIDLVVVNNNDPDTPLAVVSCKTSLHGRFSETLFYSVIWKEMIPNFIVVFATPDKGRQARKGKWESEWGTEEKPTKDRLLAERFINGVYIKNKRTFLGGKIKKIEELPVDLCKFLLKQEELNDR